MILFLDLDGVIHPEMGGELFCCVPHDQRHLLPRARIASIAAVIRFLAAGLAECTVISGATKPLATTASSIQSTTS